MSALVVVLALVVLAFAARSAARDLDCPTKPTLGLGYRLYQLIPRTYARVRGWSS